MQDQWAIVELMGHTRLGGKVSETELFGVKLGRIDVPVKDGGFVTQYFSGGSLYRLTPCDEQTARIAAVQSQPQPISPWELQRFLPSTKLPSDEEIRFDDDDNDSDPI